MKESLLSLFCYLFLLPVTASGQGIVYGDSLSDGQKRAIAATLYSLPLRDGSRYIVMDGDTILEKRDSLSFSQALLYKAVTENEVRAVCGIAFGTPHEFVRYALEKKFGISAYYTPTNILYKDILYKGLIFDDISFLFHQNSDGNNCLNQVVFLYTAISRQEAVQIKEYIQKELSWSYTSVHVVDDDLTVGGLTSGIFQQREYVKDPVTTSEMGFGFELRIISPETKGYPHLVRIMFGPF